jgi:putative intracellular protease/amidase
MKRLFLLFILFSSLVSFSETTKVLLFIRDGSPQLDFMLKKEVFTMQNLLEKSGFKVTIATLSGETIKTESTTLKPDTRLSKVKINDYAGFIFPCMAAGDSLNPDVLVFVKKVFDQGKPMAAQLGSVLILAKVGALKGKKIAFANEEKWNSSTYPELKGSIFSGIGVIQDGNIITSGNCPWMAKHNGKQDGTAELTQKLIAVMKTK